MLLQYEFKNPRLRDIVKHKKGIPTLLSISKPELIPSRSGSYTTKDGEAISNNHILYRFQLIRSEK